MPSFARRMEGATEPSCAGCLPVERLDWGWPRSTAFTPGVAASGTSTRVFSSADSGRGWRVSTVLAGYLAQSQGIASGTPTPSFVDARHGWALTTEGAGMEQAQYEISAWA